MEGNALVLHISSDAEEESKSLEKKEEREGDKVAVEYDWIKHFFDVSDEEVEQGNDVVVVDELKKKNEEATLSSKCSSIISTKPLNDDEEEDDCVILDGDPEKSVNSVEQPLSESDELLVVGEKGQIACRDYPHPRHLCGNFPFPSTPHQRHCDKCHCYVCDSLAPCPKWGTGLLTTDHCHATDRSSMWKTLRKNFKLGKNAPFPVSTNYATSHDIMHPQCNIIQPHWFANSMLPNQTSSSKSLHTWSTITPPSLIPQNQPFRPALMHTRSSPNSSLWSCVSRPNGTMPVCPTATNLSHSFPRQLLGVRSHAIGKQRGHSGTMNVGLQFRGSHMMFNNVGSIGSTMTRNHSTLVSSGFNNNVSPSWQRDRYLATTGFSSNNTLRQYYGCGNGVETQAYRQSNHSQNFYGSWIQPTRCEPCALGHTFWIPGNAAVQSSYGAHINTIQQLNKQHQIGSCQNENNVQGNTIQCGITKQDTCQQNSQSEYVTKPVFSAFNSNSNEMSSHSTYQQIVTSMGQPPSNVDVYGTHFSGSTNLTSLDDIKDWLFGDQDSVPVVADAAGLASEVLIPSPALDKIDTGMFLSDFVNSLEW